MKLKIAICDDDASQREYLFETVSEWAKRNRHLAEIRQYADAKSFLFDYSEEKDFDILLFDIEMPGMNGIELARTVRSENQAVHGDYRTRMALGKYEKGKYHELWYAQAQYYT